VLRLVDAVSAAHGGLHGIRDLIPELPADSREGNAERREADADAAELVRKPVRT
jgi:hypothetical protein